MEVFVFPIGHVVFHPHSSKPLNIFEPRYVQMINDSIQNKTPIALAHVDEPNQIYPYNYGKNLHFVRPVAGFGMPTILEKKADGAMVILLQAQGKVELKEVVNRGTPYIVCRAEEKKESNNLDPSQMNSLMSLQKVLNSWVKKHVQETYLHEQILKSVRSPEEVVGYYASFLVADPDMQQLILESDDINQKIQLIMGLVSSGVII